VLSVGASKLTGCLNQLANFVPTTESFITEYVSVTLISEALIFKT